MNQNKKLIFVYNADSSVFNQVGDLIHKTVSPKTYQCNLCGLTYSGMSIKSDWKKFINSLPIKAEFLHKDEFLKGYPNKQEVSFPSILIKDRDVLRELVSTEEINQQNSLDELISKVSEKVSKL